MIYFDPCEESVSGSNQKYRKIAISFEGFKQAFCQQSDSSPEIDCDAVPHDCPDGDDFTIQELFSTISNKTFRVEGTCGVQCRTPRLGPEPPESLRCIIGRTSDNCPDNCGEGTGPVDNIIGVIDGGAGCEDGVTCPTISTTFGCGRLLFMTDIDDASNPYQTGSCCDQRCPCDSDGDGFPDLGCFEDCDYPFDGPCEDGGTPVYPVRCIEPAIPDENGCDQYAGCPCWGDANSLQATVQLIAINLGGSASGYYLGYDANFCPTVKPYSVTQSSFSAGLRVRKSAVRPVSCGTVFPGCPTSESTDARAIAYEIEATEGILEIPVNHNKDATGLDAYSPGCRGPQTNFKANARSYYARKFLVTSCGGAPFGGFGAYLASTGWPTWGGDAPAITPDDDKSICTQDPFPSQVANPNAIASLEADDTCGAQVSGLTWGNSATATVDCGTKGFNTFGYWCASNDPFIDNVPPCVGLTGAYGKQEGGGGTAIIGFSRLNQSVCAGAPGCSFEKAFCDADLNIQRVESGQYGARFIFVLRMTAPALTDLCKSRLTPECI